MENDHSYFEPPTEGFKRFKSNDENSSNLKRPSLFDEDDEDDAMININKGGVYKRLDNDEHEQ